MTSNSTATSRSSSELVGSSMITSLASNETARAIATICWMAVLKLISGRRTSTVDVEAAQDLGRLAVHAAPVEQAEAARLAAEEDVLGHRAVGDEVDLLVDRADPVSLRLLRRAHGERPAVEDDLAGVLGVGAGQDLDHRRLAGAVLADQRMHLGRQHLERGADQSRDAGEPLVHAAHGQERALLARHCWLPEADGRRREVDPHGARAAQ